jgi:hypothetical protein
MADGANWVGGIAPADGDDIAFPSGPTQTTVTNDLPIARTFNLVTLSGTGYKPRRQTLSPARGRCEQRG